MTGKRKLAVYFGAGFFLLSGLGVCALVPSLVVAYGSFATAITTATGLAIAGNVGEWIAKKGQP